jgi:hypothetical protein
MFHYSAELNGTTKAALYSMRDLHHGKRGCRESAQISIIGAELQ